MEFQNICSEMVAPFLRHPVYKLAEIWQIEVTEKTPLPAHP